MVCLLFTHYVLGAKIANVALLPKSSIGVGGPKNTLIFVCNKMICRVYDLSKKVEVVKTLAVRDFGKRGFGQSSQMAGRSMLCIPLNLLYCLGINFRAFKF